MSVPRSGDSILLTIVAGREDAIAAWWSFTRIYQFPTNPKWRFPGPASIGCGVYVKEVYAYTRETLTEV